jgi:hypothetical protein
MFLQIYSLPILQGMAWCLPGFSVISFAELLEFGKGINVMPLRQDGPT